MMPRHLTQNMTLTNLLAGFIAVIATSASWVPSYAQGDDGPVDKKAIGILKAMSDYLGDSETISFRTKTFFDVVQKSGIKIKTGRSSTVLLKRPENLYIHAEGEDGSASTIWFDGSKLTRWRRDANEVMTIDFEGTTDAMLDHVIDEYDAQIPFADLLGSDVNKTLGEDIVSAEYIGVRMVGGVPCHQLSFESVGADWQIWIQADANPVPRRFAITYVNLPEKPEFLAALDRWSLDGEVADYHFAPSIPEGAKKVAFGQPKSSQ